MKNVKIVKVEEGKSPDLKNGEMFLDTKNDILYVGVGKTTPQDEEDKK